MGVREEFYDHMEMCGICDSPFFKRCWVMEDLMKAMATPNEPYVTPIYAPEPQIDFDFPPLKMVTCMFCKEPLKLERRGGMNALGSFVTPYYVEPLPAHSCFYDVPMKEKVAKSAKTRKRAPVAWSKREDAGLF